MIEKIYYQDSNEQLAQSLYRNGEAFTTLIDTEFGVKSAASATISKDLIEQFRPTDNDNVLIHLIAMGDSRQYGFNANGDWFDGDVLNKRASTFVTHGHVFEEHKNKDPRKANGTIKYAAFSPEMKRVELLIHLDRTKDPAGYQMAKEGKDLSFSMSCRVPNDRCSCCGNEAKTMRDYCDCLRFNMGQWMPSFSKYACAHNDYPTFFDISKVKNPADKTARHLAYLFSEDENMAKAASSHSNIIIPSGIAALEEGVDLASFDISEQLVMQKLAAAESYIADDSNTGLIRSDKRALDCYTTFPFAFTDRLTHEELEKISSVRPGTLFRELAKRASILSFPAFCQYASQRVDIDKTDLFKKAAIMLPTAFRDICQHCSIMSPITHEFSAGSEFCADNDPKKDDLVQNVMESLEQKFSTDEQPVRQRVISIIIKASSMEATRQQREEAFIKAASVDVDERLASDLVRAYGQYQIRALCDMRELNGNESVSDRTYDIIASANSVSVY